MSMRTSPSAGCGYRRGTCGLGAAGCCMSGTAVVARAAGPGAGARLVPVLVPALLVLLMLW